MTKRIYALLVLLFCATSIFAQNSSDVPSYDGSAGFQDEEKSEMTESYFPPKPKHGTEVGLSLGHHFVHGDAYARPGWGVGLHLRRAINYTISWRAQAMYGQSYGLDDRKSTFGGSGIQIPVADWKKMGYNSSSVLYRNHKTTSIIGSFQFIWNLSNILFHKKSNNWNLYAFAGPSLHYYNGSVNIKNGNNIYTANSAGTPGMQTFTSSADNNNQFFNFDRLNEIKDYLDNSYETEFVYQNGQGDATTAPGFQDLNIFGKREYNLMPGVVVGAGLARKFSERFNIAIEHEAEVSLNDNIDGYRAGKGVDVPHYTNIKLNFNLNPTDGIEPLYWVNPLAAPMERMARLEKDKVELKDSDGDGVLDQFDLEEDTPDGCPVDTKGRRLDSDNDGVFDCDDEEPFTPTALVGNVNDKGVAPAAKECESCLTRDDIIAIGKQQDWGKKVTNTTVVQGNSTPVMTGCGDWFLPMIHFDLNKSTLKAEAKASLHQIAQVMKQCPEVCIVAVGHTDRLSGNDYNQKLSYKRAKAAVDYLVQVYGISSSRLKVQYGGEETPLIDTNGSSFINRRVEFKSSCSEYDMGAPTGTSSSSTSGFSTSGTAPVKY